MDDDKLLRSLGATAEEQQRVGGASRWERLVTSELTAEELAELERLAQEDPDVSGLLLSAARPLDASARDRIASALGDALEPAVVRPVVVRPARWRARVGVVAGGLALAAGLALLVSRTGSDGLPPYALDSSGVSSSRAGPASSTSCVLHASARGSFELVARPNDGVNGTIAARTFLVRGGAVEPFTSPIEISPQGSVHLLDDNEKLTGASELRIVVGRPEVLAPEDALVKARTASPSGRGWQVLRCAVEAD